ncbi:MAG: hypothetical protein FIB01_08785 [Gemmatimonadetes bacterium]|nr:hypothetical protein [Gemmatimonadota bacterium]
MFGYAAIASLLTLLLGLASTVVVPPPGLPQDQVPMRVTLTVGGRTDTLRGTGRCAHEPNASLYGAAAALWVAEYAGGNAEQLHLTYWRFAKAADGVQFSFDVSRKAAAHRISTVKGGALAGSGRATYRPTATGGRFEIAGKAQDGVPVQATIECARFGGIYAEGG